MRPALDLIGPLTEVATDDLKKQHAAQWRRLLRSRPTPTVQLQTTSRAAGENSGIGFPT